MGGLSCFAAVTALPQTTDDLRERMRAALSVGTATLFRAFHRHSRATAYYSRAKGRADPIYLEALVHLRPDATVLDVGGGQGILSLLHALVHGGGQRRTVIDWDGRKLELGRRVAEDLDLPLAWIEGDVREADLPEHDAIACVDVLHYAPRAEQDLLLIRLADRLAAGGTLLIRDVDGGLGWRSRMTWLQEKFSLFFQISLATELHMRPAGEIADVLTGQGLEVSIQPAWGRTPFANVLILAHRATS